MEDQIFPVPEITILGIGNTVLQDEGFGVRAAQWLEQRYVFPAHVQVLDGGTLGMELLHFVTGTKKLLILDSINGQKEPGTLFRFADAEVTAHFQEKLSVHEVGIQDVLTVLQLTGRAIPEVVVIGAQPYSIEAGVGLTHEMEHLLPKVAEKALAELERWGIAPQKKYAEKAEKEA